MKKVFNYILSGSLILGVASCSEDEVLADWIEDNPAPTAPEITGTAGDLDFSNYVSIGNSLTAGLMDAALYTSGQDAAFPNILASSFSYAGGGTFNQPDIGSENGFNTSLNDLTNAFDPSAAVFGKFVLDLSIPGPVPTMPGDAFTFVTDPSSINNLGVPGMRLVELTAAGYGSLNPFYSRFASNLTTQSVLSQAIEKQPTFISFWLGNNDVLSWASSGGTGADGNDDPTQDAIPNTLVSEFSFNATLDGSLAAISAALPSTEMVILNVPNITVLPFFQAVAYNAIPLDATTAAGAQAGFNGYNAILNALTDAATFGPLAISAEEAAARQVSFAEGQNAVLVVDDQLTDLTTAFQTLATFPVEAGGITEAQLAALMPLIQARQMKSVTEDATLAQFGLGAELLTLPAATVLGTLADPNNPLSVIGVGVPLGDQYTLTTDEIGKLLGRITAFNTKIATVAAGNSNIALVDANSIITSAAINGGVDVSGTLLAPDFSPNGIYSTDGIHPNPRGHAIVANAIMDAIETNWSGTSLPRADVLSFRGVGLQ